MLSQSNGKPLLEDLLKDLMQEHLKKLSRFHTRLVNPGLTAFIKKVIEEYCEVPWAETECGYASSDRASASKAGYPSAFVIESSFGESGDHIHGTEELIRYLSFDHMLQHARMTLGLVYELGFTDFKKLQSENGVGEL
ncbi:hypothetical protein DL770_009468 [Monosporascus sp. CRB-9-2]|nr:hypothetical protein DL770_009468 [Monosporascus sp. CRB-9-2]